MNQWSHEHEALSNGAEYALTGPPVVYIIILPTPVNYPVTVFCSASTHQHWQNFSYHTMKSAFAGSCHFPTRTWNLIRVSCLFLAFAQFVDTCKHWRRALLLGRRSGSMFVDFWRIFKTPICRDNTNGLPWAKESLRCAFCSTWFPIYHPSTGLDAKPTALS